MSDDTQVVQWHDADGPARCSEPSDAYEFAETDDPRVVAVIEQDHYAQLSELFDGDAINPIYYREYRFGQSLTFVGGYEDERVADAWLNARDRTPHRRHEHAYYGTQFKAVVDPDEFADRFVRIFHGARVTRTSGGYNPDGEYLIFDTPEYREHIGDEAANVSDEAVEEVAREVRKALDGEVYGIGWAVNEDRRMPGGEIDLMDGSWEITIECYGFIGEDYAKATAFAFEYGSPDLPEMLEVGA